MGLISRVSSRTYRDMNETEDMQWMERAFQLAEQTLKNGEVPVGCILVHPKQHFTGGNEVSEFKNASRHAELVAFDKAARFAHQLEIPEQQFFQEGRLYVTVEPCIMCSNAIF